MSTDSSNLSCKRFNDDKILNPPKFNTLKRKSSLNINKMGGSNRTLNRGDANNSTLKRQNSKLSRNKAHQSEMSLSRQTSLPVNPIAETGSFHSDSLQTQLKPEARLPQLFPLLQLTVLLLWHNCQQRGRLLHRRK